MPEPRAGSNSKARVHPNLKTQDFDPYKYADGVFTQGSYLKSINVKVTGYINMILNFIEQKTFALFKLSNFKCICHFNYQKIPFVISKSNGGKRGSFFRIFCLTF